MNKLENIYPYKLCFAVIDRLYQRTVFDDISSRGWTTAFIVAAYLQTDCGWTFFPSLQGCCSSQP